MAVKMPVKISLKWWKDNYPNSMPTNKVVETLLKAAADTTPAEVGPKLMTLAQDTTSIKFDMSKVMPDYPTLLEQLKRSKATVTKDKHGEFIRGIDAMIELVRKDKAAVEVLAKKALASRASHSVGRELAMQIEFFDRDYVEPTRRAEGHLRAFSGNVANADEDDLKSLVGKNRYLQRRVKVLTNKLKAFIAETADHRTNDDANVARLRAQGVITSLAKCTNDARELDKKLVLRAVAVLGDAKGKKMFISSPDVKVNVD